MVKKGQVRDKIIRTRILSIVVSLILSFFLWLALSGQDTSTTELSAPLELANLPANLTIKNDVPTSVTLQVLANTAQLRFLTDRKLSVVINAASAREGFNIFPIDPESLDLPRGVQLRRVTPQAIEFEAVKTASITLPLKPRITGTVNPGFRVRSVTIEPKQVMVQGPQELLENLTELATTPISLDGLTRSATLTVAPAVTDLPPSLIVTPREIKAFIDLEERTVVETFTSLPIELDIKNGGDHSNALVVTPERVDITVSWPVSRLKGVTAGEIRVRVFVDLDRLRSENSMNVPVVAVPPAGATIIAINPVNATVSLTSHKKLKNSDLENNIKALSPEASGSGPTDSTEKS